MLGGSYVSEEMSNFVTFPVESLDNNVVQLSEQFGIVKNVYIKALSDGSLYLIDADNIQVDVNNEQNQDSYVEAKNSNADILSKRDIPRALDQPIYKCTKCKEEFDKISLYRKHMNWHRNIKKFKCDKCPLGYNVESNLKIHMAIHSEGKPTCPLCNISFQRVASLKSHLMLHQVEELYTCEECLAEFEKEDDLNKHLQNHKISSSKENKELVCSYCKVQFDDATTYKEHISYHIKVKKIVLSGKKSRKPQSNKEYSHVCAVCQKTFSKASLLGRHIRVHSGERPFVCQYCNKGFNQKGTLQIHLNKHTGIKPFQCTLCSAKFNQKGNLRVHVEKTHTAPVPGVKTYKCAYCTCIFKKVASLNVHITKSHTASEVDGISSVMNQLKELEKQTATITPDMKPAEKEIVEQNKKILSEIKESNDESSLKYFRVAESFLDGNVRRYLVKQRKVNDVRWYMCNFCSKEFKKPSDLIRHTRTHTREKPFTCKQCKASFSLKSSLFAHVKNHIGKKDYTCVVCLKKFSSVRTLNCHIKKHSDRQTNQQHFKCLKCNEVFNSMQKAKQHSETFENNEFNNIQIIMKQPLLQTSNGLLPVAPPKSRRDYSRRFQCHICDASFNKSTGVKRHMLLHSGIKQYKCDQCPKSYYNAHSLKDHLRIHAGIKNYGCKVCGKRYSTTSLLKRHTISHSTLKPFVCPYCHKTFKSIMICRKHMNIHKKDLCMEFAGGSGENKNPFESDGKKNDPFIKQNVILEQNQMNDLSHPSEIIPQDAVDQQLFEMPQNSVQILTETGLKGVQEPNQVQTIFINGDDLQLIDNTNLYNNLYPQMKLQNADNFFFTNLNDLQDTNVFSIDSLSPDFDQTNSGIYNTNPVFSQIEQNEQVLPSINELATKIKFSQSSSTNMKTDKEEKNNLLINDNLLNNIQLLNADLNLTLIDQNVPVTVSIPSPINDIATNLTTFDAAEMDSFKNSHTTCVTCNKSFNLNDLKMHQCQFDDNIIHYDDGISENSANKIAETPVIDAKKRKGFNCEQCKKSFINRTLYVKHINSHNSGTNKKIQQQECNYCGKCFKKLSDLTRHIRTHTGEKPFGCEKCDKKFSLKSTLLSHLHTHNPVSNKDFKCDVCNSFFSSKSSLKVHMNLHTGNKPHSCDYCPAKFRTASHKRAHMNSCHMNPIKRKSPSKSTKVTNLLASVAMDAVNQESISRQDQTVPIELVVQDTQVQLSEFTAPMNILNETNEQPDLGESIQIDPLILQQLQSSGLLLQDQFLTPVIELDYGTVLNLKPAAGEGNLDNGNAVISVGNNEKPRNLECDICHKKYASKDVLRKHRKIHGINKKFPCTKCDKGFDTDEALQKHEKLHTGYRPFLCMYCPNSFSTVKCLSVHLKRIHKVSNAKEDIFLYNLTEK